jgi:ribonuclease HI
MIAIFTDGSSRGNPGPGGWGAVVVEDSKLKIKNLDARVVESGGGEKMTTNNRMELTAAVEGLARVAKDSEATVYTDSSYVINGITKWIHGWKRNGWQTKTKEDVLNKDLWMRLADEVETRKVKWEYVGGHVGILGNERCDHIATAFADGRQVKLYNGLLSEYDLQDILEVSIDATKASAKKSDSAHSRAKAFSYVSSLNGVIETHHSWAECEKRVKGVRGAKFKKAISAVDEQGIIAEFEAL